MVVLYGSRHIELGPGARLRSDEPSTATAGSRAEGGDRVSRGGEHGGDRDTVQQVSVRLASVVVQNQGPQLSTTTHGVNGPQLSIHRLEALTGQGSQGQEVEVPARGVEGSEQGTGGWGLGWARQNSAGLLNGQQASANHEAGHAMSIKEASWKHVAGGQPLDIDEVPKPPYGWFPSHPAALL